MEAKIELFQYGELQGAPMLVVTSESTPRAEDLIAIAKRNRQPGVRGLWLKGVNWGDIALDTAILHFMADKDLERVPVVGIRPLGASNWSSVGLYWIADVTEFLAEPCSMAQLGEKIAALGFYPSVNELILRQPPLANLKPALLDELYAHLNPPGVGSIYCPPGDEDYMRTAMRCVARCATVWIARYDYDQPAAEAEGEEDGS